MNNKWYINKSKQLRLHLLKKVEKTKRLYSALVGIHQSIWFWKHLNFKVNDTSPIYICSCKLRAVEIVLPQEPVGCLFLLMSKARVP